MCLFVCLLTASLLDESLVWSTKYFAEGLNSLFTSPILNDLEQGSSINDFKSLGEGVNDFVTIALKPLY